MLVVTLKKRVQSQDHGEQSEWAHYKLSSIKKEIAGKWATDEFWGDAEITVTAIHPTKGNLVVGRWSADKGVLVMQWGSGDLVKDLDSGNILEIDTIDWKTLRVRDQNRTASLYNIKHIS